MKLRGMHGETMAVSMDVFGTSFEISDPGVASAVSVELTVAQCRDLRDKLDAYYGTPENVETPKDRLAACHRSGAQIDVGPFVVDRACDLYAWLIYGRDTRPENVEES